eukprot:m.1639776 g.1639776  ORF g.1639776 m.1639776 type:complete len:76 (-) comp37834_c0_seq1:2-229(-)
MGRHNRHKRAQQAHRTPTITGLSACIPYKGCWSEEDLRERLIWWKVVVADDTPTTAAKVSLTYLEQTSARYRRGY